MPLPTMQVVADIAATALGVAVFPMTFGSDNLQAQDRQSAAKARKKERELERARKEFFEREEAQRRFIIERINPTKRAKQARKERNRARQARSDEALAQQEAAQHEADAKKIHKRARASSTPPPFRKSGRPAARPKRRKSRACDGRPSQGSRKRSPNSPTPAAPPKDPEKERRLWLENSR